MKNSIRCWISCILPCGALDVIRIVHTNGTVEEITGTVKASEIMKAHPKHVLKKPTSSSDPPPPAASGMMIATCPKIIIVPPDAQLQRGKIYFLMPMPPPPPPHQHNQKKQTHQKNRSTTATTTNSRKKKKREVHNHHRRRENTCNNFVGSDRYLTEILSENKVSRCSGSQRDRRRGRAGVWRPHLESISETPTSEAFN